MLTDEATGTPITTASPLVTNVRVSTTGWTDDSASGSFQYFFSYLVESQGVTKEIALSTEYRSGPTVLAYLTLPDSSARQTVQVRLSPPDTC